VSGAAIIRGLSTTDIPAAFELSSRAGWNQTADDWSMLLHAAPDSCFAVECDGELAATTTLICYGRRLAWLGMVLTRARYRRRGFASMLLNHVVQLADARGIETVKLDATEQGRPLYEHFGFIAEQPVERWSGMGIADLDIAAQVTAEEDGYALTRPGRLAAYMGPCVARSPETAARLIRRCLSSQPGPWFWDLLPANTEAVAIAKELGFTRQRRLIRMRRGRELAEAVSRIYALAGFELG